MRPLPPRQADVLAVYRQRQAAGLMPPTVRELCEAVGVSSTCTAQPHINALRRKGYLTTAGGCARGTGLAGQKPTALEKLKAVWAQASPEERQAFCDWIGDEHV